MNSKRLRFALLVIAFIGVAVLAARLMWPFILVGHNEVQFKSGDVTLSGTILSPRLTKPTVGIVLVPGSGKTERMTNLGLMFALRNMAVLVYDKRGVGQSGGVYAGPEVHMENVTQENLALLSDDAAAAAGALAKMAPSNMPIGMVGVSQAGWVVPLAATKTPDVRFVVLISGPVVTTREQRIFQNLTGFDPQFWTHHSPQEATKFIAASGADYGFKDTDPRDALAHLSIPGLWLFGDKDVNVPVALSVERLKEVGAQDAHQFEYRVFANQPHNLIYDGTAEAFSTAVFWIAKTSAALTK